MFDQLELTNFRKVEHDVMNFSKGLNVIRGPNEISKSTRYEAISYAFFGTKGLKEPLADVVTYGKPETSLKVNLTFTLDRATYQIKRSKSGAELRFGEEVVTGQTEVTKYMEKLLGCTADIATKLMLANQEDIKGALASGPAASVKLIETLANFDLIDTVLHLVEEHLPSGNTKLVESRVAQLKIDAEEQLKEDTAELEQAVRLSELAYRYAAVFVKDTQADLDELNITEARQVMVDHARLLDRIENTEKDLAAIAATLEKPLPEKADTSTLPALREKAEAKKVEVAALAMHAKLKAANIEAGWEGDFESFAAELRAKETLISSLVSQISEAKIKLTRLESQLILQESCALCGKEMKDIPEVVVINNKLHPQIESAKEQIAAWQVQRQEAVQEHGTLQSIMQDHNNAERLYAECQQYVALDRGTVPAGWTWTGPTEADETDYATQIRAIETADRLYAQRKAEHELTLTRKVELQSALDALKVQIAGLLLEEAADTVRLYKQRSDALTAARQAEVDAARKLDAAAADLRQARAVLEEGQKRIALVRQNLVKADAELTEMAKNNVLVKKLRNARPQIADKLWSIVLSSVSHYFTQMRGVASVVTRSDNGFLVNGNSVTGLSGSTQDILGLAIRIALTRTFLPNVQFLCLDEPAHGCDSDREVALIGLVASCNFEQTLLVTHSDLADAFASNVITLGEKNG